MRAIDVKIFSTENDFFALQDAWNELHKTASGTVFQTFEWNYEWWKIYRREQFQLRVLTFWKEHQLIGVLPMFKETINLKLFSFSRMRFLGVYEIYGEYAPLVHPLLTDEVANAMVSECINAIESNACDMFSFFRFSPTSQFMNLLLDTFRSKGLKVHYTKNCVARVTMNLPSTWNEYLNGISPNEKRMIKRRTRTLMNHGAELETVSGEQIGEREFNDFVRLHTSTWIDRGVRGYFGASKQFEEFQKNITSVLQKKNMVRFYFLQKKGVRFAAVQAFFVNDQCCFYLSGLDRHHELTHYSPGKTLLSMVIKDAIDEGYTTFDFQGGNEIYKFQLGGKPTAFSKASVWKKGGKTIAIYFFSALQTGRRISMEKIWRDGIQQTIRKIYRPRQRENTFMQSEETQCMLR